MSVAMELAKTMMMTIGLYYVRIRSSVGLYIRTVNGVFCEVYLPYNGHAPNHAYRRASAHSVMSSCIVIIAVEPLKIKCCSVCSAGRQSMSITNAQSRKGLHNGTLHLNLLTA